MYGDVSLVYHLYMNRIRNIGKFKLCTNMYYWYTNPYTNRIRNTTYQLEFLQELLPVAADAALLPMLRCCRCCVAADAALLLMLPILPPMLSKHPAPLCLHTARPCPLRVCQELAAMYVVHDGLGLLRQALHSALLATQLDVGDVDR
jgi:hypothetical protein